MLRAYLWQGVGRSQCVCVHAWQSGQGRGGAVCRVDVAPPASAACNRQEPGAWCLVPAWSGSCLSATGVRLLNAAVIGYGAAAWCDGFVQPGVFATNVVRGGVGGVGLAHKNCSQQSAGRHALCPSVWLRRDCIASQSTAALLSAPRLPCVVVCPLACVMLC